MFCSGRNAILHPERARRPRHKLHQATRPDPRDRVRVAARLCIHERRQQIGIDVMLGSSVAEKRSKCGRRRHRSGSRHTCRKNGPGQIRHRLNQTDRRRSDIHIARRLRAGLIRQGQRIQPDLPRTGKRLPPQAVQFEPVRQRDVLRRPRNRTHSRDCCYEHESTAKCAGGRHGFRLTFRHGSQAACTLDFRGRERGGHQPPDETHRSSTVRDETISLRMNTLR